MEDLIIDGSTGGPFVIQRGDFGEEGGTVTFGGISAYVSYWGPRSNDPADGIWIKGQLPSTVKYESGKTLDVVITRADGTVLKGVWPQPIRGAFVSPVVEAKK